MAKKLYSQIGAWLIDQEISVLYTEISSIGLARFNELQRQFSNVQISLDDKCDSAVLLERSIKSHEELKQIRLAQSITDDTFSYILPRISVGRTEREIMLEMEFYLRKQGSEGAAFDFIVVSGKNSSLPHGVPTDKTIEKGDFITMDFGAVINGYCSDMTRTVAIKTVTDEQRAVYDTVLTAQKKAFEAINPGVPCVQVDKVARDYIDEQGYAGCFGHGLGHSVGIEVHESPSFNTRDESCLKPGMVLSVEPGIYLPDRFGVRIEDMVVITDEGFENVTHSSKELIIL